MSLPLPPVDFALRDELLRHSSAPLPDDLLESISLALDDAPIIHDEPELRPPGARRPRQLRMLVVLGAVVALIVAFVAIPALRRSPGTSLDGSGTQPDGIGSPSGRSAAPIGPSAAPTINPVGLAGLRGRPLLVDEFTKAFLADRNHLAGRIAIIKGPIPSRYQCFYPGLESGASPGKCQLAIADGTAAPSGYWAVKVGADGVISPIGQISLVAGKFVVGPTALSTQPEGLYIVYGLLRYNAQSCGAAQPSEGTACSPSWVTDAANTVTIFVQPDAYPVFSAGAVPTSPTPVRGYFLVRVTGGPIAQVLARLDIWHQG